MSIALWARNGCHRVDGTLKPRQSANSASRQTAHAIAALACGMILTVIEGLG
ncbi:hypothetical protein [Azospirillum palustre]